MQGCKAKNFQPHPVVSLERLVPPDNFYRQLEAKVDLSFVRDLVKDCYASQMGRPSIDPVVFFKLQLIMFFEGFRSERQLMEQVNLNLAFRWYIGYDLDERVPDHSSLSKIRDRYGLDVFQRFFEQIVAYCIAAGLVWGREFYFDGTKVQANAAIDGLVPRLAYEVKQHLIRLASQKDETEPHTASASRGFVDKYAGTRMTSRKDPSYRRTTDNDVSPTDPDATPMKRFTGDKAQLGYHTHYVVDGGKARIILAALVTPASIMDNTPMLDLARWCRFRWHLHPAIAVGDSKYGTVANLVGLEQDGIRPYLPSADLTQRSGLYPVELFRYQADQDSYHCPQGQVLTLRTRDNTKQYFQYQADAASCQACPVRSHCTTSKTARTVHRSFFQSSLERVAAYRETAAYQKAMRKRKLWPEPLFGEAKQWHGLVKFRLRRLQKVNIEGLMIAAGQNIKRLLRQTERCCPFDPAGIQALALPAHLADPFLSCFLSS